jgi:hypothetical protein
MKKHMEKARGMFLAVRPYSLVAAIMVAVLARAVATRSLTPDAALACDILFAALWWTTLLLFAEFRKNQQLDPLLILASFSLLVLTVLVRSPPSILIVVFAVAMVYWYMSKNMSRFCALTAQLPRSTIEVNLFLIVMSFYAPLTPAFLLGNSKFILTLALLIATRNFEGDIRDIDVDKNSIAKDLGKRSSRRLSALLLALLTALIFDGTAFPVAMLLVLTLICMDAPNLHHIHVIATTFFLAESALQALGENLMITHLLFLSTILNFTYEHVPRTKALVKRNLQHPKGKIRDEKLVEKMEKRIIQKIGAEA